MIQSGILYTWKSTGEAVTSAPIKGVFILFKQNDIVIKKTQTHATTGAYSIDLVAGKYTVELAIGLTTNAVRAGEIFDLKAGSATDVFQKWLYSQAGDINDALLNSFRQIADQANASAVTAKNEADRAKSEADKIANGEYYSPADTRKDKNNVLHATTKTPKDTLVDGSYGLGGASTSLDKTKSYIGSRFFAWGTDSTTPFGVTVNGVHLANYSTYQAQIAVSLTEKAGVHYRRWIVDKWGVNHFFYTDENTTVDSNGNIKKASPVVQLFNDRIEHSGFNNTPIFEKLSTGIYKISNTNGLRKGVVIGDWYVELPKDRYGERYFNVELERLDDGCIVRAYKPRTLYLPSGEHFPDKNGTIVEALEKVILNGDLIDLKDEWRCILLRFREDQYTVANEPIFKLKGEKGRYEIYKPDIVEEIPAEENIALLDQRAF